MRTLTADRFRDRLAALIESHPIHSRSSLSLACGKSRPYISTILSGKSEPSAVTLGKIAAALGVTPNFLLGFDDPLSVDRVDPASSSIEKHAEALIKRIVQTASRKLQAPDHPSIEEMMAWWNRHSGRLHEFEKIKPHVDLMSMPNSDGSGFHAVEMGAFSTASTRLKANDPDRLARFMETLSEQQYEEITLSYYRAQEGPSISNHSIVVDLPEVGRRVEFDYVKLMLPVQDAMGTKYVLNYSLPISPSTKTDSE